MLHGAPEKAVYVLDVERSTMGRDAENSVVLGDQQISKQHAAITTHGGSYWIEDLESRNGVYVNGKRVKERQQLSDGNLIKLGSTILRFEATGQGQV
jgi:pSer/pThr/pTyr-binding forkhead associated (FHA) protein